MWHARGQPISASARTAADVLESHGFGGERLLKLSRKIANDEIRRRGAFLDNERLEDLVGYLSLGLIRHTPHSPSP
jgi:hypothetical protein